MPRPVVAIEPILDERGTAGGVARLVKAVGSLVRCVCVPRVAGERTLDQPGSLRHLAGLDVGPAEITEKPPIVTPMRRQFFEQRELRFVMVAPAAEPQQTK